MKGSDCPLMLDLYSGTGSASQAMKDAGWEVYRVDIEPRFRPDIVMDVRNFSWRGRRPDLIWASPPCDEFARESMPWSRTGKTPDMSCAYAALALIDAVRPDWWVIENVRGALPYLGLPARKIGPTYLWGRFPFFLAERHYWKSKLSSSQKMKRSAIPAQIIQGLRMAIEAARCMR